MTRSRHAPRQQRGFTLLELLVAMAIFALLAFGSARLLDAMSRAEAAHRSQAGELRALGRAMSVIQRDALQGVFASRLKRSGYAVTLNGLNLQWLLGGEHDSLSSARSDLRIVDYWLEDGALWRRRRTLEQGQGSAQRLLGGVSELRWRLYVPGHGWQAVWPMAERPEQPPQALEVTLTTERFGQVRRVLPFAGGSQ